MDSPVEKVYVALGNDLQDGFKTLEWTKRRWWPKPISIVILDLSCNITKDLVYTPFGKLPASSVSDEKLEVSKKFEQAEINKLLNKYIAFCGKVKAEILKVEKTDELIHKVLVELMNRQRVTKFVMAITFMKSSFWKSKNAISGSFYIHEHKPEFCEFYLIRRGNLIVLRGENEDVEIEDDQGVVISRRANAKSWLGKMLQESSFNVPARSSNGSPTTSKNRSQWEYFGREIDGYFEQLREIVQAEDGNVLQDRSDCNMASKNQNAASRRESNRNILAEARNEIELKKQETRANSDRRAKAEWVILLCNSRVEELEAKINKEVVSREEISRNLDAEKEQIQELTSDVEQGRNRLRSIRELQFELSNKLQISSVERSNMESQLEKAVKARAEMVREIEELRRQRDVLNRRIEFCREKDAIGMVTKLNVPTCGYRQYNAEDVKVATDDFSDKMRLKSGDDWTDVYRGRISQVSVAIKLLNQEDLSEDAFLTKVKLLNEIRHPNLVAMMGFCTELKCVIFEYMHNGNLRDILVSSQRIHRRRNRVLRWNHRIRIAREVCVGLSYLHSAHPRPIVHGNLCLSNVLLDRNLVAKITGIGLTRGSNEHDTRHDIRAFGVLLLHLLRGANPVGLEEETATMDREALAQALDETGGQWPLDLVEELVGLASRCLSTNPGPNGTDLNIEKIMEELNEIKKKADDLIANVGSEVAVNGVVNEDDDSTEVPSIFLCPILQDVMKNPHVAADGFSYELEAIEEWFRMGRDTSPMTNLKLKHKFLTPNHTLRFLVEDWQNNTLSAS